MVAAPCVVNDQPNDAEYPFAVAIPQRWRVFEETRQAFGQWSDEALLAQLDVAHSVNLLAQLQIEMGRFPEACRNLVHVDGLTERAYPQPDLNQRRLHLRGELLHNFACVRKAQGKVTEALKYADKALHVMLSLDQMAGLPQCYLNLSSLMSATGLHTEALKHAL
eukprot:EG_transcript_36898